MKEQKIIMAKWKVKTFLNSLKADFTKEQLMKKYGLGYQGKSAYINRNGYITFAPMGLSNCTEIMVTDGWNRNLFKYKKDLMNKIESIIVEPAEHKKGTVMDALKEHLDMAIEEKDFEEATGIIQMMKKEEADSTKQEAKLIQHKLNDAIEVEDYETAAELKNQLKENQDGRPKENDEGNGAEA